MKLHSDTTASLNTVTAYGDGWIDINAQRHPHSVLVFPDSPVQPWSVEQFEQIDEAALAAAAIDRVELIVVGTGARQRFIHPRVLVSLHQRGIGVESMDTRAACRTYNILMAEGRKVAAALLVEPATGHPT
ncbi:Mth938-like domain-containing protein [soil metagenome]